MSRHGAGCLFRSARAAAIALAALAGACADAERVDPFTATGELVSLSGGDAGARAACIGCHGLRGQGDGEATPWLSGMPRGHLQKQLEDYASGLRESPVMGPIAKALDHGDRAAVAGYYAGLSRPATALEPSAVPALAERLYRHGDPARGLPACASCHGEAGEGLGAANPPLAGQPRAFLELQLRLWREGRRRNDPLGQMLQISRRLTPSEAAALAAYLEQLAPAGAPAGQAPAASPS